MSLPINSKATKKLIILDTFCDFFIANISKNKLQIHGIESFLVEEGTSSPNFYGSIALKIFSKDLKKAFRILSA